jgi:hypothetical protein
MWGRRKPKKLSDDEFWKLADILIQAHALALEEAIERNLTREQKSQ